MVKRAESLSRCCRRPESVRRESKKEIRWGKKEYKRYSCIQSAGIVRHLEELSRDMVGLFSLEGKDLLANGVTSVSGVVKDVCVTEHLNPERAASCNQVPELRYSLTYDQQKAELCVALLEGKGLRSATSDFLSGRYKIPDFIESSPPTLKSTYFPRTVGCFTGSCTCRTEIPRDVSAGHSLGIISCTAQKQKPGTRMDFSSPSPGRKPPLI